MRKREIEKVARSEREREGGSLRSRWERESISYFEFLLQFSGLIKELPLNVHLLTLQFLEENKCLIRLEHQFEASEKVWGNPVTVSLNVSGHMI